MENPRPEKVAVVEEVRDRLSSAGATILTEYRGLKVAELAELRRNLNKVGGEYHVYKNTLVRFAVRDLGLDGLEELLIGPTALTFVTGDPVDVAKALRDYARANPALVVKGGILGTSALSADAARALADVPPRPVLLARLAGGLAAPMQQFASLLQALPRNFAYGLKALVEKRNTEAAPTEAAPTEAAPTEAAPTEAAPTEAAPTEAVGEAPSEVTPEETS